jgi:hypothetical protein
MSISAWKRSTDKNKLYTQLHNLHNLTHKSLVKNEKYKQKNCSLNEYGKPVLFQFTIGNLHSFPKHDPAQVWKVIKLQ